MASSSIAQRKKKDRASVEQSPQQEFVSANRSYLNSIKTIQFYPVGKESNLPIYTLGTDEQLLLSFDDLRGDVRTYYYSIIHCNADWEPSRLSPLDYAEGYNEDRVDDYTQSQGTTQAYTHYTITFPTNYVKPKVAGNYIISIYEDADKSRLILTQKFFVVRPLINIAAEIIPSMDVSKRIANQKLNVILKTSSLTITNPDRDVQVHVYQNQREDHKIIVNKPMFVGNNEIKYTRNETLDFAANNEFRYVDLRSFRLGSNRIQNIQNDSTLTVNVMTDLDLSNSSYASTYDENGKFYIRNMDFENAEIQSDYADIRFSLQTKQTGNFYVVGAFNNFQRTAANKLSYNAVTGNWEVVIKLKQGLYDYEYVKENEQGNVITNAFNSSFYETGNDYQILVYHRRLGTYWDELLGVSTISIHNKENKN